jgi:YHS domain-containing protein
VTRRAGLALAVAALLVGCASSTPLRVPSRVNAEQGVAINGYDPVAYFAEGRPREGRPEIRESWQGAVYRFASEENRVAFLADPERYVPQYGGYCAIAMAWNRIADVDPHQWAIVDGRLYLNNSAFAHGLWSLRRRGHIRDADRNWEALRAEGEGASP